MRRKRTDHNQRKIVTTFEQAGWLVKDTSDVGGGFPDLVVQGYNPRIGRKETLLVEVKRKNVPPSQRKLTDAQERFHAVWKVYIVQCIEDVVDLIQNGG